jgi:predicted transcriptional regulator
MSAPVRQFTKQQLAIARGIANGLSYAEIGAELGITEHTVRAHVKAMALVLDEPAELPPRYRILYWAKGQEWEASK